MGRGHQRRGKKRPACCADHELAEVTGDTEVWEQLVRVPWLRTFASSCSRALRGKRPGASSNPILGKQKPGPFPLKAEARFFPGLLGAGTRSFTKRLLGRRKDCKEEQVITDIQGEHRPQSKQSVRTKVHHEVCLSQSRKGAETRKERVAVTNVPDEAPHSGQARTRYESMLAPFSSSVTVSNLLGYRTVVSNQSRAGT